MRLVSRPIILSMTWTTCQSFPTNFDHYRWFSGERLIQKVGSEYLQLEQLCRYCDDVTSKWYSSSHHQQAMSSAFLSLQHTKTTLLVRHLSIMHSDYPQQRFKSYIFEDWRKSRCGRLSWMWELSELSKLPVVSSSGEWFVMSLIYWQRLALQLAMMWRCWLTNRMLQDTGRCIILVQVFDLHLGRY